MLMRKTSAPASNSFAICARSDEAGPSVATILVRRCRLIAAPGSGMPARVPAAPVPGGRRRHGHQRRARAGRSALGRFGELHRPGPLLPGVDLEEPGAVVPAREAVRGSPDG